MIDECLGRLHWRRLKQTGCACFDQHAFIIKYITSFTCFCLFYFILFFLLSIFTFLINCEFEHACILGFFPLPSLQFFSSFLSFFLSFFLVSFFCNLSCRFLSGPIKAYKNLEIRTRLYATLYFTTKSKSAQIIFHLLTLLLHTICDALVFSTPSPNLRHNYTVMLRMVKKLSCFTDQSLR